MSSFLALIDEVIQGRDNASRVRREVQQSMKRYVTMHEQAQQTSGDELPQEVLLLVIRGLCPTRKLSICNLRGAKECMLDAICASRVSKAWLWSWREIDVDETMWKDAVLCRWPCMADVRYAATCEIHGVGVSWRSAFSHPDPTPKLEQLAFRIHLLKSDNSGAGDFGSDPCSDHLPASITIERSLSGQRWSWAASELVGLTWHSLQHYSLEWGLLLRGPERQSGGQLSTHYCSLVSGAKASDDSLRPEPDCASAEAVVVIDVDYEGVTLRTPLNVTGLITLKALCQTAPLQCTLDELLEAGGLVLPRLALHLDEPHPLAKSERSPPSSSQADPKALSPPPEPFITLEFFRRVGGGRFGDGDDDSRMWLSLLDFDEPGRL